jgi:hypothetical protein
LEIHYTVWKYILQFGNILYNLEIYFTVLKYIIQSGIILYSLKIYFTVCKYITKTGNILYSLGIYYTVLKCIIQFGNILYSLEIVIKLFSTVLNITLEFHLKSQEVRSKRVKVFYELLITLWNVVFSPWVHFVLEQRGYASCRGLRALWRQILIRCQRHACSSGCRG